MNMPVPIVLKIRNVTFKNEKTARVSLSEPSDRFNEALWSTDAEVSRDGAQWFIDRIGKTVRLVPEDM